VSGSHKETKVKVALPLVGHVRWWGQFVVKLGKVALVCTCVGYVPFLCLGCGDKYELPFALIHQVKLTALSSGHGSWLATHSILVTTIPPPHTVRLAPCVEATIEHRQRVL